jgi:simple sugar transport system ATP-binding protein
MAAILELKQITKEYHGVAAVKDVDFSLIAGEIHALLGENGAGKSTLTKMMAGVVKPTSGSMLLDGKPASFANPAEALSNGIAMVFQETSLIPTLTVAQNLYLGTEKFLNRLRSIYISAQQFFQSLNFAVDPTAVVSTLGAAQKQMVEIARAVHFKARIIIFDEPTASLTPEEKHYFFSLLRRLKTAGVSIIFISHALEEALEISDRITVMRDGLHVLTEDTLAMNRDLIIKAMVGRSLSNELYGGAAKRKIRPYGKKLLSVQNLSMGRMVRNNSFSIYAGQVTGIFGLVGSGRTETAKIVAGIAKRDLFHGGEILFEGAAVRFRLPRPAVKRGIAYVTEDRKIEGFFETMSIAENIHMNLLSADLDRSAVVSHSEIVATAKKWIEALKVRAIDGNARVIELSGGNQQKVVIARSLVQTPRLVIFDELTRGVDVGAIADLHQIIHQLADEGLGVVVISSYLPEIMSLSDRILISRQGRIVEEFSAADAQEEKIMYAAVH